MSDLQAAVLGFVQGLTEWLPISSTAHLRIIPALLGWGDPGAAFTAIIQWGTFFAALVYFRRDIVAILTGKHADKETEEQAQTDRRLLVPIMIGTLPVIVAGILFKHKIEGPWRSLYVVAWSMIIFAIILWIAEITNRARRPMGSVTNTDGLLVGIGQAFALIPGASRSGTTITAALFVGLERSTAARFSFLLSLPAVFLAGAKELYDALKEGRHSVATTATAQQALHARPLIIATVIAFIVGWITIDWLIKFLRKHPTYVFIVYRLAMGAAILGLLASHRLQPMDNPSPTTETPAQSRLQNPGSSRQSAHLKPAASRLKVARSSSGAKRRRPRDESPG